jgi:hypothetical protein
MVFESLSKRLGKLSYGGIYAEKSEKNRGQS